MNEKSKIDLSASEMELVCNKEWILTKLIIIDKVYELFGTLAKQMQLRTWILKERLPKQATSSNPKISKGESYQSLPYVMLDYPRHFTRESTLAIRTLFWWGNFFSINLHLAGECKVKAMPLLNASFKILQLKDYSICTHTDPWQHHFDVNNFIPLAKITAPEFAGILDREPFLKIAKQISLRQWDDAPMFLENHFNEMIMLLQVNYPAGEINLSPGIPITGSDL